MIFGIPHAAIALALIVVSLAIASFLGSHKSRRLAEEDVRRAGMRGWHLQTSRAKNGRRYSYSGWTDGINWRFFTYVSSAIWKGAVSSRWETGAVKLDNDILAIFPSYGKPDVTAVPANSPGVLVKLAADALVSMFAGDEVDAQNIARAQVVHPRQAGLERYWFRATHPELMTRFLDSGAATIFARESGVLAPTHQRGLELFAIGHTGMKLKILCMPDLDCIAEIVKLGSDLSIAANKAVHAAVG